MSTKPHSIISLLLFSLLTGCSQQQPPQLCTLLQREHVWSQYQHHTKNKLSTILAIIQHESGFRSNARPVKSWLVPGLIPWEHHSSAYGFSQAIASTWQEFKAENPGLHQRESYYSSVLFIDWYLSKYKKYIPVNKRNHPYELYLLYHEGPTAYQQTHRISKATKNYAAKVAATARKFEGELKTCHLQWQNEWRSL